MIESMRKENYRKIYTIVFLGCIFLFLIHLCRTTVIHFDGAMNFEVAYNLAKGNGYATSYHELKLFDPYIQTGSPILIPSAILNVIFGSYYKNMQVVLLGYLFLFLLLIYLYSKKNMNTVVASVVVIILLSCPHVTENAYAGFGEMSMAVWMLGSMFLFTSGIKKDKKFMFLLTGVCIGLGYLTKTVFLICGPAFAYLVIEDVVKKRNIREWIVRGFSVLLGAFFPIFLFEMWKLSSLGVPEYVNWWERESIAIFRQTGVGNVITTIGDGKAQTLWEKISSGLQVYADFYGLNIFFTCVLYALPVVLCVFCLRRRIQIPLSLRWFIITAEIYFIWFIAIMPSIKRWARRVVVGHCFIVIAIVALLYIVLKYLHNEKRSNQMLCKVIGTIAICMSLCNIIPNIVTSNEMMKKYAQAEWDMYELSCFIETLPQDANFYGYGWWRNSHTTFTNDVLVYDLSKCNDVEDGYYVVDFTQTDVNPLTHIDIVNTINAELIFSNNSCYVYRILPKEINED